MPAPPLSAWLMIICKEKGIVTTDAGSREAFQAIASWGCAELRNCGMEELQTCWDMNEVDVELYKL